MNGVGDNGCGIGSVVSDVIDAERGVMMKMMVLSRGCSVVRDAMGG